MTIRDLTDLQLLDLRRVCRNDRTLFFASPHFDKTPPASFDAGFNAGMKATLSIVTKSGQNSEKTSL